MTTRRVGRQPVLWLAVAALVVAGVVTTYFRFLDPAEPTASVPDIGPEEALFVHTRIAPLATKVKLLGEQKRLTHGEVRSLLNQLGLAHFQLASANPRDARHRIGSFARKILEVARQQKISPGETKLFMDSVQTVVEQIIDLEESQFTVIASEICQIPVPCTPIEIFVDADANAPRSQMDGSPAFPFHTLAGAMARAESQDMQCIEVHISAGSYDEGYVTITRDTALLGEPGVLLGVSLQNSSGHSLRLEDLEFVYSGLRGAGVASVDVDSDCASTSMKNVDFVGVGGNAVHHDGGSLEIMSSLVSSTATQANDAMSGIALWLSGGVDVCLSDVALDGNQGGALLAEGMDTRVFASKFRAESNLVNPLVLTRDGSDGATGAVELRDSALLLSELAVVQGNQFTGLLVHDGARARLRYSTTGSTQGIPDAPPISSGAINAAVRRGSMVMTTFSSHDSAISGVQVIDAEVRLTNGYVYNNPVGAHVAPESSPLECMQDNVLYFDNGVNLDSSVLPLPDTDSPLPGAPESSPPGEEGALPDGCAQIVFAHPWCSDIHGL